MQRNEIKTIQQILRKRASARLRLFRLSALGKVQFG
jgi:hypothetical protein